MDNVRLEVKIRSVPKDPRNLILLACPEPSLASVVATEYLIDSLKMNEIGAIRIRGLSRRLRLSMALLSYPTGCFTRRRLG